MSFVLAAVMLALAAAAADATAADGPSTAPVVQTDTGLRLDTPQLRLEIPGQWKEQKPSSSNVVYSGMSAKSERHITVAVHLLEKDLTPEKRREAVRALFDARVSAERELTQGQASVRPTDIVEQEGLLVADYVVTHPAGGRVAFSHLVCDREKAVNIYWEVLQLRAAPDLKALLNEFERITDTLKLK